MRRAAYPMHRRSPKPVDPSLGSVYCLNTMDLENVPLHKAAIALAKDVTVVDGQIQLSEADFVKWGQFVAKQADREALCVHLAVLGKRLASEGPELVVTQIAC